ncbi:MAG: Na+/H+ antiporter, partial [Candidatus Eremiobacterota bacterium]
MHPPEGFVTILALALIAVLVAMAGGALRLPYAVSLVVAGIAMAPLRLVPEARLEPELLLTVLLPPLIFESALNLRLGLLRANWKPLTIYAVVGTIVSSLTVGFAASWLLGLPLGVALVFGALISSTDPISVVAVFKQLKVGKRLSLLVEGESLLNDGVSVVLYSVLLAAVASGQPLSFPPALSKFVVVVAGGVGVGLAVGLLASRITREFDDPPLEIVLTCLVAWGAFLAAEHVHVSGVIATVTAGLTVETYGMATGMSATTRLSVNSFWEFAGFLANSMVFLLLGIQESMVNFWGDLPAIALAFLLVLAGRAVAVYGLAPLVNALGAEVPMPWQHVMVWSGLRGALAVALVSGLPAGFPEASRLVHLTYGVVLFSLLLQGLSMGPVLRFLRIRQAPERLRQYRVVSSRLRACQAALAELSSRQAAGVPRPVVERLSQEYRERIAELEEEMETLQVSQRDLFDEQLLELRRLALSCEKASLVDDMREGVLDEHDMLELAARVDEELDRLHHP